MKRLVRRAWGWYFVILDRAHFKVKILRFRKLGALSTQLHHLRHEMWLMLSGRGMMTYSNEDISDTTMMSPCPGDVIIVEKRHWHKFDAFRPCWFIEVQYGERCIEEDIIRVPILH